MKKGILVLFLVIFFVSCGSTPIPLTQAEMDITDPRVPDGTNTYFLGSRASGIPKDQLCFFTWYDYNLSGCVNNLIIDDISVIPLGYNYGGFSETSGAIALAPGKHKFRFSYWINSGEVNTSIPFATLEVILEPGKRYQVSDSASEVTNISAQESMERYMMGYDNRKYSVEVSIQAVGRGIDYPARISEYEERIAKAKTNGEDTKKLETQLRDYQKEHRDISENTQKRYKKLAKTRKYLEPYDPTIPQESQSLFETTGGIYVTGFDGKGVQWGGANNLYVTIGIPEGKHELQFVRSGNDSIHTITLNFIPGHRYKIYPIYKGNQYTNRMQVLDVTVNARYNVTPPLIFKSGIMKIEENAFAELNISNIDIPDSVTSIGKAAFYNNQLTSVTIPNRVTSIGASAFERNRLASLVIPNKVTVIEQDAFRDNRITSLTIPDSVTSIGQAAFANNRLTSITIPNKVTSLGYSVFSGNPLTSITIGRNVSLETEKYPTFGNNFGTFYNNNGKKAGTYTYSNGTWSIGTQSAIPPSTTPASSTTPAATAQTIPRITGGFNSISGDITTPRVGKTIKVETDGIKGEGTLTIRWLRDNEEIAGAEGSSYTMTDADIGKLITVKATREGYKDAITWTTKYPVISANAPNLTGNVTIVGKLEAGQTLTADTSGLMGTGQIWYQWTRKSDGNSYTTINNATSSTYKVTDIDVKAGEIHVRVAREGNYGEIRGVITTESP